MSSPETFVRLLDAVRDHLTEHPVPADISSVQVAVNPLDGEHATVHLRHLGLAELAGALLGWADTLTEITATAWRPPTSDRVHLAVTGRLATGPRVEVYGGVPFTESVFGADLQSGGQQSLALSVLRGWATDTGEVAA